MATTTNFGWETPDDTDLVKDGALAIRTLGNAIDTSLVDLKGGTTGQVLSKTSNTDMDFTWINNDQGDITAVNAGTGLTGGGTSGSVTLTNDMATTITAAGDIVVGTGSGTYDNLPIGTTGQVLTADTTVSPYKVKWATAGGGGLTLLSTTTLSGASTQITIASNTYAMLLISVEDWYFSTAANFRMRLNAATGTVYGQNYLDSFNTATQWKNNVAFISLTDGSGGSDADNDNAATISIFNPNSTVNKLGISQGTCGSDTLMTNGAFTFKTSSVISSVTLYPAAGNFSGGTVKIYGA